MPYQTKVDRNLCIGTGDCVNAAANTFELDSESKSTVKAQGADSDESLMNAAKICPVSAIILADETGKQIFP